MFKLFSQKIPSIPANIQKQLLANFPEAKNIEWSKTKSAFEALFYISENEYIAKFDAEGKLLEHKINLKPFEVPEYIKDIVLSYGELMNTIEVFTTKDSFFEIIYRDKNLDRFLLFIDKKGIVLNNSKVDKLVQV